MSPVLVSVQEMIENVRLSLRTDTATLLLLDGTGTVLEPAASAGLGRRWRGAPHIAVGSGFAGRVAEVREPVVVDDVNESSVLNPILREVGVRRLLGVPVFGKPGLLLGVLHVGLFSTRSFTRADVARLEDRAEEIGRRLSERIEDDAHLAALVLQRGLLPAAPPTIAGLDLAVRYLPAEGDLGGDWYDIFSLPGGRVGLVMGDVEGHGLRPAIVMGRLRSALRAYALDHEDPAVVLHHLDRKLCHFEPEISATVVFAVTEPPFDRLRVCNAGHPQPLVLRGGQTAAELVDISSGVLLGVDPELVARTSEEIPLGPDTTVVFYTDGLVERRATVGHADDPYGPQMELVRRSFSTTENAETACSHIVAAALGDDSVEDDVALVVLRRSC